MIKDKLHQKIIEQTNVLHEWFIEKSKNLFFPFYASFDLRDSGLKIVPIDSNLFPAGFNNICAIDKENIPETIKNYLSPQVKNIILLTEEHTNNLYYWDNISCIKEMLEKNSAFEVTLCVPEKKIKPPMEITSASGKTLVIEPLSENLKNAHLILSNNDFSTPFKAPTHVPINPPYEMGWHARRKNRFFKEYNALAKEFASLIDIDSWHLTIKTEMFEPFTIEDPQSINQLKESLDHFLKDLRPSYEKQNETPFVFIKNNTGTYGLGVTSVETPSEVESWNYKTRKKMKAAKEGQKINQLILQEGIPTILNQSQGSAEPVIYTIGSELIGGFLRVHQKKGARESLNSPGAVFRQLCMSDLKIQVDGKNEENVYGWITRLSLLALALEIQNQTA